jgi:hypothetical protein
MSGGWSIHEQTLESILMIDPTAPVTRQVRCVR